MKIAIVHDELVRRGGAEQVTLLLHRAFPEAPIYTSCYNPKQTYPEFSKCNIHTSWINPIARNEKSLKRVFFPLGIWAMQNVNLKQYDVVLISTTTSAKFVKVSEKALFIAFCHFPFRLAWFPVYYSQVTHSKGFMKLVYSQVIRILKKIDLKAAQRIDWYITNTSEIKQIINECYQPRKEISIIPASIPCSNFYVEEKPMEDFYLVVSRLEPYKRVDMVIEAFNQMPDLKLVIVGKGSQKEVWKAKAGSNIEFKEGISKEEIGHLYANCKAFIFPQYEDYGLTPLEANASGRPVIAFGEGGVTYTTIPYTTDSKKSTAVFFNEQTVDSLVEAIKKTDNLEFDPQFIRKNAEKFDEQIFIDNIRNFVYTKYKEHTYKESQSLNTITKSPTSGLRSVFSK